MDFPEFFRRATGRDPFPYQVRLATTELLPELLDIPTGLGKTAAAVLAWLWRRRFACEEIRAQTPRRLVYCLPMRVLVEQTRNNTVCWLHNLGRLDGTAEFEDRNGTPMLRNYVPAFADPEKVTVHILMGGEDEDDWDIHPERDAILIGTQDMLLSRALNRGYGRSRYKWPIHFGLLNNDCLWVMDEVQLMGSGLVTTAQIAAFGEQLWPRAIPCQFLWMSATLGESFLDTRDRRDWGIQVSRKQELSPDDLANPEVERRLRAPKTLQFIKESPKASRVLDEHGEHAQGRLLLLVLNTVPSAKKLFSELSDETGKPGRKKKRPQPEVYLVHGRFRPADRQRKLKAVEAFASKMDHETGAVAGSPGLILVSTQVVEAGFDISSVRLWSEIAPWPSDIQRLGRLNREGKQPNAVATFWMPREDKDRENNKDSPNARRIGPYDKQALKTAEELLKAVKQEMEAGSEYRDALDKVITTDQSQASLQVAADAVIRPDDFHELFSTEPDLAGGFTNVSPFVRDFDRNVDVHVFWRDFKPEEGRRLEEPRPQRDELCPVPFFELQRFLGDKVAAWGWNSETSLWEKRRKKDVQAGMTLLLPRSAGGYSDDFGWTGSRDDKPTVLVAVSDANDGLDRDPDCAAEHWYLLNAHLADVDAEVRELAEQLGINDGRFVKALSIAAQWHDWGKSLEQWQKAVSQFTERVRARMNRVLEDANWVRFHALIQEWLPKWDPPGVADPQWAKFPDVRDIWNHTSLTKDERKELRRLLWTSFSPKLRHEAASALAAWNAWLSGDKELSALAVYLIASHHGKARTVLRSTQDDDEVFGLTSRHVLRPVPGRFERETPLHFEAKHLGAHGVWDDSGTRFQMSAPSWTEVMVELLGPVEPDTTQARDGILDGEPKRLGPFLLAYLEAILRIADARASRKPGKGTHR